MNRHGSRTACFFLFWPAGTYTNLNSHRELNGRPFFALEIMNGSDFQKNKPRRCNIKIQNEVKTFHFGDHIRTWTVISKKKVFTLFSNQRAARGFNSFSKSGPSREKLAHPWSRRFFQLLFKPFNNTKLIWRYILYATTVAKLSFLIIRLVLDNLINYRKVAEYTVFKKI